MKLARSIFSLCGLMLASASYLYAAGETGAAFLKLGVGVKALGMGTAFTAVADDPSATFWNPAGLTLIRQKQFTFMHDEYLVNYNYEYIGFANPLTLKTSMGTELHYGYLNDIRAYDQYGNPGRNVSAYDGMLTVSGSHILRDNHDSFLSLGGSLKIIQQKLVDERANAFACDLGALYQFLEKKLAVGFVIHNLGTQVKFISEAATLPREYRLGTAYTIPFSKCTLMLSADLVQQTQEVTYFAWGMNSKFWDLFDIRAGYRSARDTGSGLSIGAGTVIGTMGIDYAFIPYGDLGNTHKFSISFKFGEMRKDIVSTVNEEKAAIYYERAIRFKEEGDDIMASAALYACLQAYPDYRDAQLLLDSEAQFFYGKAVESYEDEKYEEALRWVNLSVKYNPRKAESNILLKRIREKVPESKQPEEKQPENE